MKQIKPNLTSADPYFPNDKPPLKMNRILGFQKLEMKANLDQIRRIKCKGFKVLNRATIKQG